MPVDSGRTAVELVLPFAAPPREVKEIASIKGKLSAIIPGKVETFQFDNLLKAKNVEKHIAGVTVTLEGVQQNNEAWEVRIRVKFDEAGDALASHRGWIFQNEAYLEGPDGKPIAYDAFETTRQAQGRSRTGLHLLAGKAAGEAEVHLQNARRAVRADVRVRVEEYQVAV